MSQRKKDKINFSPVTTTVSNASPSTSQKNSVFIVKTFKIQPHILANHKPGGICNRDPGGSGNRFDTSV